jgi:hypothetical protein
MRTRSVTRSAIVSLAAATVLAMAALPAWAAGHGPATTSRHDSLAGQEALQGRVTDLSGHGITGARVVLYAWPGDWPGKRRLHRGETVPIRQVGQAVSTAGGRYAIRIRGAVLTRPGAQRAATAVPQTAIIRASALPRNASLKVPNDFCYIQHTTFVKNFSNTYATINESYLKYSGRSATVTRYSGQNTSFSVGVSGSNGYGSFSASGSFSWSSHLTVHFTPQPGPSSDRYQSQFTPGDYKVTFSPGTCSAYYFTQPDGETGSYTVASGGVPTPTHCVSETDVASIDWNHTSASTVSAGMTISAIGFTASTQTGWTTSDTLTYSNTANSETWYLCGLNAVPGSGSPGVLGAE